jgi:GTP-binding nuclear protein Ran
MTRDVVADLILCGDFGVGKTAFVKRLQTGKFENEYIPTIGCQNSQLTCQTQIGTVTFNVRDLAGQKQLQGLIEGYCLKANCAIIMCDVTAQETYRNIRKWYMTVNGICPNIPIVVVGNKVDVKVRRVNPKRVISYDMHEMHYYEISVMNADNLQMPFLSLARLLSGDPNLRFTTELAFFMPEGHIDEEHFRGDRQELEGAQNVPPLKDEE